MSLVESRGTPTSARLVSQEGDAVGEQFVHREGAWQQSLFVAGLQNHFQGRRMASMPSGSAFGTSPVAGPRRDLTPLQQVDTDATLSGWASAMARLITTT